VRVSVALATYSGSQYIEQLLNSLATQQHLPLELVVGDDCSNDDTVALLQRFASRSPFPVRISVNPMRLGYADNFLAVAADCVGDVVAFCDQDDVWHSDKLTAVVEGFGSSKEIVLVAHYARVVDASGSSLERTFPRTDLSGRYSTKTLPLDHFPGFTLAVKRELFAAAPHGLRPAGGDPRAGMLGHDLWVWLLAGCIGESLILPDKLVSYRQHENLFGDSHVTRMERVRRALNAGGATYDSQAEYWRVLASYLETLASRWSEVGRFDWAENAVERAGRFHARAEGSRARSDLYLSRRRRDALRYYVDLHHAGTYQAMIEDGLISRHAPLKDLLSLLFRRLPIDIKG
jgi:glycosyltransferase involved in cell wall biosynthesis